MKRYDLPAVDRLYARVWGESIHFGIYAGLPRSLEDAVLHTKSRMAEIAKVGSDDVVIEVGSGWGATARYLTAETGCTVLATNYSFLQAAVLAQRSGAAVRGGKLIPAMADFHALPFADESVDVYWCQECLVHARDKARVFAEAFRVLKPGGRIVFSDQTTRAGRLDDAERDRIAARHGSRDLWDGPDFEAALSAAGFEGVAAERRDADMGRHFENLFARLSANRAALDASIGAEIVAENADMWAWGAELAATEKIGWSVFSASKGISASGPENPAR